MVPFIVMMKWRKVTNRSLIKSSKSLWKYIPPKKKKNPAVEFISFYCVIVLTLTNTYIESYFPL